MAESIIKIGQVDSTVAFDNKTNAQFTEFLESLMPDEWNGEGMGAKEKLQAMHVNLWEVLMRASERRQLEKAAATMEMERRRADRERREKARESTMLFKPKKEENAAAGEAATPRAANNGKPMAEAVDDNA